MYIAKEIKGVSKLEDYNDNYFIVYNDKGLFSFVAKKNFSFVHKNKWFKSLENFFDGTYILVQNEQGLYSLLNEYDLSFFNENLWFTNWNTFDNEFFIVDNEDGLSTLIRMSDADYLVKSIWFKKWEKYDFQSFKAYDIKGKAFLIKKESGQICPISKKNDQVATIAPPFNNFYRIDGPFYAVFKKDHFNVKSMISGTFVFSKNSCKEIKFGFHKFDKKYWIASLSENTLTLIEQPNCKDVNQNVKFPITKNGKPLLFKSCTSFNDDTLLIKCLDDYYYFYSKNGFKNIHENIRIKHLTNSGDNLIVTNKEGKQNLICKNQCEILCKTWFDCIKPFNFKSQTVYLAKYSDKTYTILRNDGTLLFKDLKASIDDIIFDTVTNKIIFYYKSNLYKIDL